MKRFSLRLRQILLSNVFYYILLVLSIIYIGLYYLLFNNNSCYDINDKEFILTISDYNIDGDKLSFTFKENLVGTYYFKSLKEKDNFNVNINDKLIVNGSLKVPSNNSVPNTFNYKKYLYYKKINYILNIETFKKYSSNNNIFYKIKNKLINRINNINNNEYLYAFILGKSRYIDEDVYNNYKINGITHLFALSGLHVSLFSNVLLFIFKKIKFNNKLSYIITSLFLILFSFIASFTPSILRATIFFILSGINEIYYFYIKPINIMYLTFSILVFINPFYIFNLGFILSFTITFFILLFNNNYEIKGKVMSILIISLLSFASSFPIIINTSYEINIIGFINNLFFIPYVSYIIFPTTLITLFISKLSVVLSKFIILMEYISSLSSNLLNITLIFSKMSIIEIILYYLVLILFIKYKKKIFIFIVFLFITFLYIKPVFNKNTYVIFNDVSQGDSVLIIAKDNTTYLIDTGGKNDRHKEKWAVQNKKYNLMKSTLITYFKSLGIKEIDYLIITHGDYDHMGEAINLVESFKVEKVIFNCGEYNELEQELIKVLDKEDIPYYSCINQLDNLYFLQTKEYDNENDNSNVIYTEINGYKFMFMGDAGIEKEKDILNKYNISNIDVLKVGHHGSKTSSGKEFINEMNPTYSVISVGKNNRYGHPNKEVLNTLSKSIIYRTDEDGSILFKIKDNKLKIETCSP